MYEPHEFIGDHLETDDQREGRVYGAIEGQITDITDNDIGTRCKARLVGMSAGQQTDWLDAGMPGSIEATPNVGDTVIVMFVEGDPHRGFYFCHPISTSKGRPTEPAVLGKTFVGMVNFFATQFNQLLTDFNAHTHAVSGAATGAPASPSAALSAGKGLLSDNSAAPNKNGDNVVLSGKVKLR